MAKRWTISGTYLAFMMILMVVALTGLGGLSVYVEYSRFRAEAAEAEARFMESRKATLVQLTNRLEATLDRDIALAETSRNRQLKDRVMETCAILLSIHSDKPATLPMETRHNLMRNALRNARSEDNERFFFALDTTGGLLFNAIRPELDGTPVHALPPEGELPIALKMVDMALSQGDGFLTYRYPKPADPNGPLHQKTSYIRLLKPLGWIVGSGYYLDDFYQELQPQLIQNLPPIDSTRGDEVFIYTNAGVTLIGKPGVANNVGRPLSVPEGTGAFINIDTPAEGPPFLAYLRPYPRWGWVIGASADRTAMTQCIKSKQQELKKRIHSHLLHILFLLCTTLVMTTAFSSLFARHLARCFAVFNAFFKKASHDFTTIDPEKFFFPEFKSLADSANRMTRERHAAEVELGGYRELLEEKVAEKTRELTEAKGQVEMALEAKSRFLANISHEIKTPMNAIMGVAELLEAEGLNDKQRSFIGIMNRSSRALMILINDMLDFSRAESGKIIAEAIAFNYRELMKEVIDTFTPQAQKKGLDLRLEIDPEFPASITGDPLRIRQVLVNLAANAIKFTPRGRVTLSCRVGHKEAGRLTFITEIRDTGIGIDFSRLPHGDARILFEPFSQADSSTTREFGGTGLGLAICQKIVTLLGGEITVESVPDQGSCFSFRLTTPWEEAPHPLTPLNAPPLQEDRRPETTLDRVPAPHPPFSPHPAEIPEASPLAQPTELDQSLSRLHGKLTGNVFDTETEIEQLRTLLPPDAQEIIDELVYHIANFDYHTALDTLGKIRAAGPDTHTPSTGAAP